MLEVVQELLSTGRQATQRDLYYRLLCPPIFNSPADVHGAIQVSDSNQQPQTAGLSDSGGGFASFVPCCVHTMTDPRPRAVYCPRAGAPSS